MRNKSVGIVLAFGIIGFVLLFAVTDGFMADGSLELGSMTTTYNSRLEVVSAFTASTTVTDGYYDSFDSPGGTSYAVGSSRQFVVSEILANPAAADIRIDYGYGDTHVENSASAPTNAVFVGSVIIETGSGLNEIGIFMKVPSGKYPFVRQSGASSVGHVTMLGVSERAN